MSKIYIDDVGKGYPLVLVHGYLGSSEMWCNQKDFFSSFLGLYLQPYLDLEKAVMSNH
jgi:pimeloyl-ACP methyl ester carboxylesterase